MMRDLLEKSRVEFLGGIEENGETKAVDFFISELTNSVRKRSMLIRPSQIFGILTLLKEKIPSIKAKTRFDYSPSLDDDFFDEGQVWLDLEWEGEFPETGPEPTCFRKI